MSDEKNMSIWNKVKRPPIAALKTIKGGRLSGMSNISPQWRWQVMTETFGMVGFGWRYTIDKKWSSPGANDEHFCFVEILLYVKVDDVWSDAIPGSGGSMLVAKEKSGMHNNDEAFKMAETDALGTAMAKLGVAADIYLGTFDGSKYKDSSDFESVKTRQDAVETTSQDSLDHYPPEESTVLTGDVDKDFVPVKFTVKQIRNSADHIGNIAKDSGKTVPDVLTFIKTLESTQEYSIKKIVKLIKGEE